MLTSNSYIAKLTSNCELGYKKKKSSNNLIFLMGKKFSSPCVRASCY